MINNILVKIFDNAFSIVVSIAALLSRCFFCAITSSTLHTQNFLSNMSHKTYHIKNPRPRSLFSLPFLRNVSGVSGYGPWPGTGWPVPVFHQKGPVACW